MRLLDYTTDIDSAADEYRLYAMGDVHIGNRNSDLKSWRADIARIAADPNGRVILMGDIVDAICVSDKRFDSREVDPTFREWFDSLPQAEVMRACDELKGIKDKIICILSGNHEEKVRDITARVGVCYDPHYELCQFLNVPSLDYCGFVRWRFRESSKKAHVVLIYATHGHGSGRTAGSHALAIDRLMDTYEADVSLFAHRHQLFAWPKERLTLHRRGKLALKEQKSWGAMTGSYLKTATPGFPGYAARAGYAPVPLGMVQFNIFPRTERRRISAVVR